ncbi:MULTISPECIES: metal-dependent transcriptional regulator [Ureibacillus]|uniref:metal-dependent transcriptional regulator n=1 Tax=Ureibacillus TaxID=160795 RepID=UPI002E1A853D|nr:metal-dependent transcriptional regulator [Ureibacillus terrenus]
MVSPSKEKYLIEIFVNLNEEGYTRVSQLAKSLQVSVPSVSKMVKKLNDEEYIKFQRYGIITLTDKGKDLCEQLLKNRLVLIRFFKFIGVEEEIVEDEVKAIQHNLSVDVIEKIDGFLAKYQSM